MWTAVGGWAVVIYISQFQFPQTDRNSHGNSGYINFDRDMGLFLETKKKTPTTREYFSFLLTYSILILFIKEINQG